MKRTKKFINNDNLQFVTFSLKFSNNINSITLSNNNSLITLIQLHRQRRRIERLFSSENVEISCSYLLSAWQNYSTWLLFVRFRRANTFSSIELENSFSYIKLNRISFYQFVNLWSVLPCGLIRSTVLQARSIFSYIDCDKTFVDRNILKK